MDKVSTVPRSKMDGEERSKNPDKCGKKQRENRDTNKQNTHEQRGLVEIKARTLTQPSFKAFFFSDLLNKSLEEIKKKLNILICPVSYFFPPFFH